VWPLRRFLFEAGAVEEFSAKSLCDSQNEGAVSKSAVSGRSGNCHFPSVASAPKSAARQVQGREAARATGVSTDALDLGRKTNVAFWVSIESKSIDRRTTLDPNVKMIGVYGLEGLPATCHIA
jgi:hypothetical protein